MFPKEELALCRLIIRYFGSNMTKECFIRWQLKVKLLEDTTSMMVILNI